MIDVLKEMLHPETLPLQKNDRRAHYEGSIDKTGGNADWDWCLYKDERGEYVLFEQYGAGCIYNFVQHRLQGAKEVVFRFYFDNDTEPRFEIKPSQFGEKYPFIEPLASKYIGPTGNFVDERGFIRIVRSFVPMPFTSYCKITSDLELKGNDWEGGGWGHVVYHTFANDIPVMSFDPLDDGYRALSRMWRNAGGGIPTQMKDKKINGCEPFSLKQNERKTVFTDNKAALITAIKVHTKGFEREDLLKLWINVSFDGKEKVSLPFGCMFGNELGANNIGLLYLGSNANGDYYNYYPMPYLHNAEIEIVNKGKKEIEIPYCEVVTTEEYNGLYTEKNFGYFSSTPYCEKKYTEKADSVIAKISGISGHVAASVVTGYRFEADELSPEELKKQQEFLFGDVPVLGGSWASCEGDARIHFDGIRTPCIESDGSESYACYGYGFCSAPQTNPVSGYDSTGLGYMHPYADLPNWSMVRTLPGDVYPFYNELHFAFESGDENDISMYHSGAVMYYGNERTLIKEICSFEEKEEELTSYFEGDDDHIPITLGGTYSKQIILTLNDIDADEIILRRVSDQNQGRQKAQIFVNGEKLPTPWYYADFNPYKKWLEDEYVIPKKFTAKNMEIRIVPLEVNGKIAYNQFGLKVFSVKR